MKTQLEIVLEHRKGHWAGDPRHTGHAVAKGRAEQTAGSYSNAQEAAVGSGAQGQRGQQGRDTGHGNQDPPELKGRKRRGQRVPTDQEK